jgi:hypothetical protein
VFLTTIALILLIGFAFPLDAVDASNGTHVVINEFDNNPSGTDSGREWIELYNPTTASVTLTGWVIGTSTGSTISIATGTVISAKGYFVLNVTAGTLANNNLGLTLRNNAAVVVDATPNLSDTSDNGFAWARFPNGFDSDLTSDWRFQQGTYGASNGKRGTSISIALNTNQIDVFQSVTITGAINASIVANVSIQVASDSTFTTVATVTATATGAYSYVATVTTPGTYRIRATWPGDEMYNGATSSTPTLTVNKLASALTLQATPGNVTLGRNVTVQGTLSPAVGATTVTLTYRNPNGTVHTRSLTTLTNGTFHDSFPVPTVGAWTVQASWPGDATHNPSNSPNVAFNGVARAAANVGLIVALVALAVVPPVAAVGLVLSGRMGGRGSRAIQLPPRRGPFGRRGMPLRPAPPLPGRPATDLKPLKVGNGALCPICFRPMTYKPQTTMWQCDTCGRTYHT